MRQLLVLGAVVGIAVTAVVAVDPGRTGTFTCRPGPLKINDQPARAFCGPATAVVHVGGQTLHFSQGLCTRSGGVFTVNIGTEMLPPSGSIPFFSVFKRGSSAVVVSYRSGNVHDSLLNARLVQHGSVWAFSGDGLLTRKHATGTFRCS